MSSNDRPVGVFDSGMGGLTVLRALRARLPNEHFVYLGDTARLPYGSKSPETVVRYAVQCAGALARHHVKMLVVACNTASAVALPALDAALAPAPVIGVVEAGADAAVAAAPNGRIAVIATEGTVKGGAYLRAIHARAPNANIVQQACPLLVALAEEGVIEGPIAELVVRRYLEPMLMHDKPECILLACTHYPVLADTIARVAGPSVTLVNSAETAAAATARLLTTNSLARSGDAPVRTQFLATDAPERFARVGEIFLGEQIDADAVQLVDL